MLALHPGPDLHDGVLEFDFVGVTLKLFIVIFGVLHVVVEDVVQRYLGLVSLKEFIDDLLLSIFQVTPALHHTKKEKAMLHQPMLVKIMTHIRSKMWTIASQEILQL